MLGVNRRFLNLFNMLRIINLGGNKCVFFFVLFLFLFIVLLIWLINCKFDLYIWFLFDFWGEFVIFKYCKIVGGNDRYIIEEIGGKVLGNCLILFYLLCLVFWYMVFFIFISL